MPVPETMEHPDGVTTIDVAYIRPWLVASHLVVENGHAVFIDTGTSHSVPYLLEVLESRRVSRQNVDYVMVTHVHLDHAGGAGALLRQLPNAKLVVHPKGARHMIDPTKLVKGSMAIYGAEQMEGLYGEIVAVPEDLIMIAEDDWHPDFQGRPFYFLDGPGHASHHYCVFD